MGVRVNIDTERVVALYREGLSMAKIAERFGVTITVIVNRLNKAGVARRARGTYDRKRTTTEATA